MVRAEFDRLKKRSIRILSDESLTPPPQRGLVCPRIYSPHYYPGIRSFGTDIEHSFINSIRNNGPVQQTDRVDG